MEQERTAVKANPPVQKVITPLCKWIMDQPIEEILAFLHKTGIHYSLTGNSRSPYKNGLFACRIFIQSGQCEPGKDMKTVREYEGNSHSSIKVALCAAFSKFLVMEDHDFHIYKALPDPDEDIEVRLMNKDDIIAFGDAIVRSGGDRPHMRDVPRYKATGPEGRIGYGETAEEAILNRGLGV